MKICLLCETDEKLNRNETRDAKVRFFMFIMNS